MKKKLSASQKRVQDAIAKQKSREQSEKDRFNAKNEKFLNQGLVINTKDPDGKITPMEVTVKELVHRVIKLQNDVETMSIFTLAMAKAFYAVHPAHDFFSKCDERFMEKLRGTDEVDLKLYEGHKEPETPATEAPATEAPATEAPATEAPATEAPATEAPATEAPATEPVEEPNPELSRT